MKNEYFLYQINWNRNKYPEICEALEQAKAHNGVAWYLRKLISEDIAGKQSFKINNRSKADVEEHDSGLDETGGFL